MRQLTARQKLALRMPGTRLAVFVKMEHPDGTVYAWSGSGIIDHDGQAWLGCGLIAGVSGVGSSTEPQVSQVGLVLTGVPADLLNVTDTDLKGYVATLYHAIMTPDDRIVGGLEVADVVDLDYQDVSASEDGSFTIAVIGQSGFWQLENASMRLWSPEQARADYPDGSDTGFDALHEMENLEIPWTRT